MIFFFFFFFKRSDLRFFCFCFLMTRVKCIISYLFPDLCSCQLGREGARGVVWRLSSADVGKALCVNKAHRASRPLWSHYCIWGLNCVWGGVFWPQPGLYFQHSLNFLHTCNRSTPSVFLSFNQTILSVGPTAAASS